MHTYEELSYLLNDNEEKINKIIEICQQFSKKLPISFDSIFNFLIHELMRGRAYDELVVWAEDIL